MALETPLGSADGGMPPWEQLETIIPGLYRFAWRLTGQRDRAEDLTQETLLKAWEKRRQLREEQSLRVWLFRIAVNLWRDQARQRKRDPVLEPNADSALDRAPEPSQTLGNREEVLEVLKVLEQLPPRQREVLHLSAVEEFRVAEIAEILGISPNAVKVNLCEARKKMRDAFPLHHPQVLFHKLP
jgi:RNA polymerase sigma-70 factor (ECF subfamily)